MKRLTSHLWNVCWMLLLASFWVGALQAQSVLLSDSTSNWIPAFSLQESRVHSPEMGVTHGAMLRNAPIALERPNGEVQSPTLRTEGALWRNPWTGNVPLNLIPASDIGLFTSYGQRYSVSSIWRQSPKPVIELDFFERGQEDRTLNLLYGQNLSESIHLEIGYSTINERGIMMDFKGTIPRYEAHFDGKSIRRNHCI